MWEHTTQSGNNSGVRFWSEMILLAVFVAGAVASAIIYWKSITSSGEDMVDRTNLLI